MSNRPRALQYVNVPPRNTQRLSIVQTLRGLAAFMVAWSHFARANGNLDTGIFRLTAPDPSHGVTIFFVISGFVLPYSLWKGGYITADYGRFILKRIARLDPPYFVSIAIAIAAAYVASHSPLYRGVRFSVTIPQLLLHVGYLNAFFGMPWINLVYWTLAIEFQFYLTLGLFFPVLKSGRRLLFAGFVALCAASQFLSLDRAFLPYHWPLFLMGIVVFQYKADLIRAREAIAWIACFSCWAWFVAGGGRQWEVAAEHAAVGAVSALCIMYLAYENTITVFFADISYSFYLVHAPIGSRIVNLLSRYAKNQYTSVAVAVVAMSVSIACAYLLYRWVEKPAQQWASRIRYRAETERFSSAAASAAVISGRLNSWHKEAGG